MSSLGDELRALCVTDPGITLLSAVEYIAFDAAHRIALYRLDTNCTLRNRYAFSPSRVRLSIRRPNEGRGKNEAAPVVCSRIGSPNYRMTIW
jgi:hypothetical protein